LFLLTQVPFGLATALLVDAVTPAPLGRPWNRVRGWRLGSGEVRPPRFKLTDDHPSAIHFRMPLKPSGGADIRLWIKVLNPNPFAITLEKLETRLILAGYRAAYGNVLMDLSIDAGQSSVVSLNLSFSSADLMLNPAVVGPTVNYRLNGVVWIDAGKFGRPMFGPIAILSGELPVASSGVN
jgi:hypothetical protein